MDSNVALLKLRTALEALCAVASESVELSDWPELQAALEQADRALDAFPPEALTELARQAEVGRAVEGMAPKEGSRDLTAYDNGAWQVDEGPVETTALDALKAAGIGGKA